MYGSAWFPSYMVPVWADAVGRMRMLSKGNVFCPGGSVHVERVPFVGVLVYLWVDGHPTHTNDWSQTHEVPKFCPGSQEVSDALLFAAALGRWKKEPLYVVKGVVERSMGGGETFYPPVWVSAWQSRDVLPLYVCDFEVRSYNPYRGKMTDRVLSPYGVGERAPRVPKTHRL